VPALTEIWRAIFPGAVLASPGGPMATLDPDPAIGWVRVLRARVPAFDALDPGDLAILPEAALAALSGGPVEPAALIDELRRSRVPAVLIVGEDPKTGVAPGSGSAAPDSARQPWPAASAVIEAARGAALPVLYLQVGDPAAIERSVIGFLVNRGAELDRQASRLVNEIERLALEDRRIEELVGSIGGFLSRAVAIENQAGGAVVIHAPEGAPAAAAAVSRYRANPRAVALRVDLPGGGTLALLGQAPATDLEREAAGRAAPLIALELSRGVAIRRARDAGRGPDRLPVQGPPWVVVVARQVVPGEEGTVEERAQRRDLLARLAPPDRLALRGDVNSLEFRIVVAVEPGDPAGLAIAERVADAVGRPVAVSRPFGDPTGRPAAEAEARATLEAAEPLIPAHGGRLRPRDLVSRADRLSAYRLLAQLGDLPGGRRLAEDLLAPLRTGRLADQAERLVTLRSVLAHGSAASAAADLGIHRNTLLYRVRRIEALTGWQLDDPQLRPALAIALYLVQSA
jgi:hypothetical protein